MSEAEMIDTLSIYSYKNDTTFDGWVAETTSLFVDIWFENELTSDIRHKDILINHGSEIKQLRFKTF